MRGFTSKKLVAGLLSAVTLCSVIPAALQAPKSDLDFTAVAAEESGTVIFSTGFEDGEGIDAFTGRKGVEVFEATTEDAYSGDYSMKVSGRADSWNGPQFRMDTVGEAGVQYTISAAVKTEWYNNVMLSWEYTDTTGERNYGNLATAVSNGDWAVFENVKFTFSEEMTNVYVYLECSDTANMYVDDFSVIAPPVAEIEQDIPSLKNVYANYFKIGTAVTAAELAPQTTKNLIEKHFNSITPGNELKPSELLDREASIAAGNDNPQVSLAKAESILNYCRDNNIPMRGHVLVWHSQTPDWFFKENYADDGAWVSEEVMLVRMENYIKNVFAALEEQYPTVEFYAWDVVNEAWLDNGSPRNPGEQGSNGSENSAWVQVFGDNSFIKPAFEFANKYAPEGCKLYYNDFNEYMPQKTAAIVAMVEEINAEEQLIDGIGCQSHLASNSGSDAFPSASAYKTAIAAFAATGLDIQITEIDATITKNTPTDANFEAQAQYYSDIMDVIVEYKDHISAVVFWGTTDDRSWRNWGYPLLFNEDYSAKACFYSIIDGIEYDEPVVTTTTTTEPVVTTTTTTTTEPPTTTTGNLDVHIVEEGAVVAADGDVFTIEDSEGNQQVYGFTGYDIPEVSVGDVVSFEGYFHEVDGEYYICHLSSFEIISSSGIVYGDTDCNGEIELNDAVLIMCNLADEANNPISEQGRINGDVYSTGDGINNMDALAIQKYKAQLISELPESYME